MLLNNSFLIAAATVQVMKLKHLQSCLNIIVELIPLLTQVVQKKLEVSEEDANEFSKLINEKQEVASFKSCSSLLILVKQRLQYTLRLLIKLCMTKPPINKESSKLAALYKTCYSLTFQLENQNNFYLYVDKLVDILSQIYDNLKPFHLS